MVLFASKEKNLRDKDAQLRARILLEKMNYKDYGARRCMLMEDAIHERVKSSAPVAVIAVGGFAHRNLAPLSDVDVLFVLKEGQEKKGRALAERVLYHLWNNAIRTGHHILTLAQCLEDARRHQEIATSLLFHRYIAGHADLYEEFTQKFEQFLSSYDIKKFMKAKRQERLEARQKMGGARFAREPHLKDGAGALRDIEEMLWIARLTHSARSLQDIKKHQLLSAQHYAQLSRAHAFYRQLRLYIHALSDAPQEHLSNGVQKLIAKKQGYKKEYGRGGELRLMRHYFLHVRRLRPIRRAFFFKIAHNTHDETLKKKLNEPLFFLQFLVKAQKEGKALSEDVLVLLERYAHQTATQLRTDSNAGALFLQLLCAPHADKTLRHLSEIGFLHHFIHEAHAMQGFLARSGMHAYNVDEHTWRVIQSLGKFKTQDIPYLNAQASSVKHYIRNYDTLFVAAFFHDIAKWAQDKHPQEGEKILRNFFASRNLKCDEDACFIVRHHLAMSNYAFHRDIDDIETVKSFEKIVENLERLRLLFIFTIADISCLSENSWNGWKSSLLWRLYRAMEDRFTGRQLYDHENKKERLKKSLAQDFSVRQIDMLFANAPPAWFSQDEGYLLAQGRFYLGHVGDGSAAKAHDVRYWLDEEKEEMHLMVLAPDAKGLGALLTGAIAHGGGDIIYARIYTMQDNYIINDFIIAQPRSLSGQMVTNEKKMKTLCELVNQSLLGTWMVPPPACSVPKSSRGMPKVTINNELSNDFSIIEIIGEDRHALLYDVTSCLSGMGINIHSAIIGNRSGQAVDVFYVRNKFGRRITAPEQKKQIIQSLKAIWSQ